MRNGLELGRVVVAAGSGSRFGGTINKPFVHLGGRPVLLHSLSALARIDPPGPTVLVYRPGDEELLEPLRPALAELGDIRLAPGGSRRRDSVLAGLTTLPNACRLALIHDAVRPFPPPSAVQTAIRAAERSGAAILAHPASDTLKRTRGDRVTGTVDREGIVHSQTPQVFDRARLVNLLEHDPDGTITDEATLFEMAGEPVVWIPGDPRNIKITTGADLRLAEALLESYEPPRS